MTDISSKSKFFERISLAILQNQGNLPQPATKDFVIKNTLNNTKSASILDSLSLLQRFYDKRIDTTHFRSRYVSFYYFLMKMMLLNRIYVLENE